MYMTKDIGDNKPADAINQNGGCAMIQFLCPPDTPQDARGVGSAYDFRHAIHLKSMHAYLMCV